jgi:hypothetical protein
MVFQAILSKFYKGAGQTIIIKKEKGTPPWYVKDGGHPMESVRHGL